VREVLGGQPERPGRLRWERGPRAQVRQGEGGRRRHRRRSFEQREEHEVRASAGPDRHGAQPGGHEATAIIRICQEDVPPSVIHGRKGMRPSRATMKLRPRNCSFLVWPRSYPRGDAPAACIVASGARCMSRGPRTAPGRCGRRGHESRRGRWRADRDCGPGSRRRRARRALTTVAPQNDRGDGRGTRPGGPASEVVVRPRRRKRRHHH